jgi:hypothetical protein
MIKDTLLKMDIIELNLNDSILKKLKCKGILIVEDLWKLKRKDLKNLGFSDMEISQIIVKLQLNAIDLNKKIY